MNTSTKQIALYAIGLTLAIATLFSCNKSTSFGADLLEDQIADFDIQELQVNCTLETIDKVTTADLNSQFDYFPCGRINDADFGTTTAEIFSQITLSGGSFDFENARFDSAFLILPYDVNGFYGDTLIPQNLRIYQLADTIANSKRYLATDSILVGDEIASINTFLPRPRTPEKILDTAATAIKAPHLKVPLSSAFGSFLLSVDSSTMTSDFAFWRLSKGIKLVVTPSADPGAMVAFDLNSSNCFIRMYYTVDDTVSRTYRYNLKGSATATSNKFLRFAHDYTGSKALATIGVTNPERMYMQGLAGIRMKVEFPTAAGLENIVVNKAELELNALDDPFFPVAGQLLAFDKTSDTTYIETPDVTYAFTVSNGNYTLFGGKPQPTTTGVKKYQLTLTKQFQDFVDATDNDPSKRTIYLSIAPQVLTAGRTVFYGANDPNYPVKLRLKYTKL
jgi:hypothetical protein